MTQDAVAKLQDCCVNVPRLVLAVPHQSIFPGVLSLKRVMLAALRAACVGSERAVSSTKCRLVVLSPEVQSYMLQAVGMEIPAVQMTAEYWFSGEIR